jgi:hypothetical protein
MGVQVRELPCGFKQSNNEIVSQARTLEVHRLLGTLEGIPPANRGYEMYLHAPGAGEEVSQVVDFVKYREGTPAFPYVSPHDLPYLTAELILF